jgi:hypothetical protein
MAGKIFINYRRGDDPSGAARVRDRLASTFGDASIFMDVDNVLVGQRFDEELAKALAQCDVLIAVIGPRWMELWKARAASGERDHVREEIAEALKRKLVVIPVRVGVEGQMPALPREQDLPEDISALVLHQKKDVTHERFGRDIAELIAAIKLHLKIHPTSRPRLAAPAVRWGWVAAGAAVALILAVWGAAHQMGVPVRWPVTPSPAALKPSQQNFEDGARRVQGETFRDCNDGCPEMVVAPAGSFTMGSPTSEPGRRSNEGPQRTVTIRQPLAVGKFEVTIAEYEAFVTATGGVSDGGGCNVWTAYGHQFQKDRSYKSPSFSQGSRNPVVCVTWQAATTFPTG